MRARALGQRLALVVLGVGLGLAVIEGALQGASLWLSHRRRAEIPLALGGNEYRILCIGESTTQGAWWVGAAKTWPQQLEDFLRQQRPESNFKVINQGLIGASTPGILELVDGWLDTYKPQVVVTMLGINDEGNVLVYDYPGAPKPPPVLGRLRLYKLLRLLWRSHWSGPSAAPAADAQQNPELQRVTRLFNEAVWGFQYTRILELERDLVKLEHSTPVYHYGHMLAVLINHESDEHEVEFFRTVLKSDLRKLPDTEQETLLRRFLDEHPDNVAAYTFLTTFYYRTGRQDAEEAVLKRVVQIPSVAGYAAVRLAEFYRTTGHPEEEAFWWKQAQQLLPQDRVFFVILGDYAFRTDRYPLAAEMYEKALALRTDEPIDLNDLEYGQVALSYQLAGDTAHAEKYFSLDAQLNMDRFKERTRRAYQQIVEKALSRNAIVIAMQYPMLSVGPLKKMLDYRGDVIFVDNEATFKEMLKQSPYGELFVDHFAGSFGHLTVKGNALIAQNVTRTLLGIL